MAAALAVLFALSAHGPAAHGQAPATAAAAQGDSIPVLAPGTPAADPEQVRGALIRVMVDPNLGDRWLVLRDSACHGGPGRLVHASQSGPAFKSALHASPITVPRPQSAPLRPRPIIRAGDRLVLEENSPVAVVRLAAVALESATAGSSFRARVETGGRVVRAVALGPGHAAFAPAVRWWR